MKSLAFVAVVALVTLLLIGALLAVRTSQQSAALASPTATRTVAPVPTASPMRSRRRTSSGCAR